MRGFRLCTVRRKQRLPAVLCDGSDFGEETSSDFMSYVLFGTVQPSNQPYVRFVTSIEPLGMCQCFQCTAAKAKFELQVALRYRSKIIAHQSPYSCLQSLYKSCFCRKYDRYFDIEAVTNARFWYMIWYNNCDYTSTDTSITDSSEPSS